MMGRVTAQVDIRVVKLGKRRASQSRSTGATCNGTGGSGVHYRIRRKSDPVVIRVSVGGASSTQKEFTGGWSCAKVIVIKRACVNVHIRGCVAYAAQTDVSSDQTAKVEFKLRHYRARTGGAVISGERKYSLAHTGAVHYHRIGNAE